MPSVRDQTFSEFLVRESVQIDLVAVAVNLLIAAVLAFMLGRLYVYFGRASKAAWRWSRRAAVTDPARRKPERHGRFRPGNEFVSLA